MIGILFALGAALSSGIEKILRRHVLIKEDSVCYAFLFGLFAAVVLLPLFFIRYEPPVNNNAWLLVILSGVLWTLYGLLLAKAYTYLEASVASPISRLKLFFVLLLSIIFLNETISVSKIIGTTLIFMGVVIINLKSRNFLESFKEKGVVLIIISTFVISIALLVDKYAMNFFSVETYTAPVYLMSPLLLIPFILKRKDHLKSILKRSLIPVFFTSLLSVGYYYLILNAFKYAEASIVVPITEISTLFTVLGGIFILKERKNIMRKVIATIIVIFGAILLSINLF